MEYLDTKQNTLLCVSTARYTNHRLTHTMVLTYLIHHAHILSTVLTAHNTLLTQMYEASICLDSTLKIRRHLNISVNFCRYFFSPPCLIRPLCLVYKACSLILEYVGVATKSEVGQSAVCWLNTLLEDFWDDDSDKIYTNFISWYCIFNELCSDVIA